MAAYSFAMKYVEGRRALDLGCGEGYGAALLAETAADVCGVDADESVVRAAREKYPRENLTFEVLDLAHGIEVDREVDIVVSMQTIEHIDDDKGFLACVKAVLGSGATAIISTPNRLRSVIPNPLHYREYSPGEFCALCGGVFGEVRLYGVFGSDRVERWIKKRQRIARIAAGLGFRHLGKLLPRGVMLAAYSAADTLTNRVGRGRRQRETRITQSDFHRPGRTAR